jgi:prophage regulatory protein
VQTVNRILKQPEVSRVTGLSRSSIYRLEALGQFPLRVKLSEAASGWRSDEIEAWIDSRPRAAQRAAA